MTFPEDEARAAGAMLVPFDLCLTSQLFSVIGLVLITFQKSDRRFDGIHAAMVVVVEIPLKQPKHPMAALPPWPVVVLFKKTLGEEKWYDEPSKKLGQVESIREMGRPFEFEA